MPGLTQPLLAGNNLRVGILDFFEAPALTLPFLTDDSLWLPLGVIEPGSFKFDPAIEEYEFNSGLPETLKKLYRVALKGEANLNIAEFTAFALRAATGSLNPTQLYAADVGTGKTLHTAPGTATQPKFLAAADAGAFAVGDEVEVELTDTTTNLGWGAGLGISYVTAVDTTGGTITIFPSLTSAPKASGKVKKIGGWKQPIGTADIRERAYRSVFTDVNGEQVITWIPKAVASGSLPTFPAKKEALLPLKLKAYAIKGSETSETTAIGSKPVVAVTYLMKDQSGSATSSTGKPLAL